MAIICASVGLTEQQVVEHQYYFYVTSYRHKSSYVTACCPVKHEWNGAAMTCTYYHSVYFMLLAIVV